jgi:hypothetical protein
LRAADLPPVNALMLIFTPDNINIGMQKKPRAQYEFLPKAKKKAIDFATPTLMIEMLRAGMYTEFCEIVGVIANLKQVSGVVSQDHEKILKLPMVLLREVEK